MSVSLSPPPRTHLPTSARAWPHVAPCEQRKAKVTNDEEQGTSAQGEDETNGKQPGMGRLLALNAKEWYLLVIGIIGSAGLGVSMPMLALALSGIIAVFFEPDPVKQKEAVRAIWPLLVLSSFAAGS